jgi:hypothetical protein
MYYSREGKREKGRVAARNPQNKMEIKYWKKELCEREWVSEKEREWVSESELCKRCCWGWKNSRSKLKAERDRAFNYYS